MAKPPDEDGPAPCDEDAAGCDGGVLRFWPFFIVLLLGARWKVVARTRLLPTERVALASLQVC